MKFSLSQLLYFFTLACCLLFIIHVSSIISSSRTVELAFERDNYAHHVDNHTNRLKQLILSDNFYSNDYVIDNWSSSQEKLTQILGSAPDLTPQQQTIQNSIHSQNENVKRLFEQINKNQLKNASEAIKKHLKARLMTQLESIRSDSLHLSGIVKNDIHQVLKQEVLFIICSFAASVMILLFGAFRLTKIFRTSLREVKRAFAKNHSGSFQQIELTHSSKEFDSIVMAFNAMNKKLSETTVSLEVMKKIVEERTQVLEQLSNTDPLTQVANRRALYERGNIEVARVQRSPSQLSLILLDCDYFKKINDDYGHAFGDELLKHICKICYQEIRDIDFLARYGGEEFIIVLPNCDLNGGIEIARRIQGALACNQLVIRDKTVAMTLSIGISMFNRNHQNFEQLINDADQAMYRAKEKGRNRIEV